LRANYLGQIGHLLAAAHWAENPDSYSSCQEDIDWDGQPECVFASQDFFATFERMGGYMAFAFHRSSHGVHQVVGPTYQFLVGMSDPTLWNPNLGIAGDPGQILGALVEDSPIWKMYDYQVSENELWLYLGEMAIRKVFRFIGEDQIHMDLSNPDNTSVLIPFALDPWTRFIPGWGNLYQSYQNPDGMIWGIDNQLSISIDSGQPYEFIQFNRSHTALFSPEDPNYDYSAGHFLPFPMALLRINNQQTASLDLIFSSVIK